MVTQTDKVPLFGEIDGKSDETQQKSTVSRWEIALKTLSVSIYLIFIYFILIYSISSDPYLVVPEQLPEQLHLSLGVNDSEYIVTWATKDPAATYLLWCEQPGCKNPQYAKGYRSMRVIESSTGEKHTKITYRARMLVVPGKVYTYKVSACHNKLDMVYRFCSVERMMKRQVDSSRNYTFETKKFEDHNRRINAIFYGDLGLKNAQSVPRLEREVNGNDLIIHNGDFAYDLDTDHGEYGDRFMRLMEPIAASIPYQTSVGNHEIAANFSEYDNRFSMINRGPINHGQSNNFFYSFNAGPVHFIAISTEFYYFLDYVGVSPLSNQYKWLKEDLKFATSPAERVKRPWIVVFGHRPMYCSSRDHDDCSKDSNLLRRGLPFTGAFALEKLFYDFGVDVELYSHEHQYERFLPIYDGVVFNGTDKLDDPYYNPRAPVHLISGSAGCQEKLDPFKGTPVTGSVKQIVDYGYTRIIGTRSSLTFEQVSDDQFGDIVDKFTITKDRQNFPPTLI